MRFDRMITAVDAHAAGEPGRVITGGVLDVPGATMLEKMAYLRDHADDLRKLMLREPRGYPAANCNLVLPPTIAGADAGYVIMEQVEYPAMSGSNTICVVTVLIETGMVPVEEPVTTLRLESPAGLIEVQAEVRDGRVMSVTFRNVPAFAMHLDAVIEVPHLGTVTVDVAWGGMFYVIADAERFGLRITPDEARDIVRIGEMLKLAAQEQLPVRHPGNPDLAAGVTIAQISGLTVRHRHECPDGLRACSRPAGPEPAVCPRGHPGHDVHRATGRRDQGGRSAGGGSHDHRPGLDHGLRPVRPGTRRSVSDRLHPDRHLGHGRGRFLAAA
jgi:proline racemase